MFENLPAIADTSNFMPHGHCYLWTPALLWMQVTTNSLIGIAYVGIAATLAYLVRKGEYLPFKGMALAFGIFIIACGITHFMDVLVIWQPRYWLDSSIRVVTALASIGVAVMLPRLVPQIIGLARGARHAEERGVKLEAAVADLSQLYEKTRELDEVKTQFFANVSHELRTPLALILGPVERLLQAENLEGAQRNDLQVVQRNARLLLKHVNDLLDVSRLEAGKMDLEYTETDMAELLRLSASQFEGLSRERDIELGLDVPATLVAEVDADKMRTVVLNLLSNAFKFTPASGRVRCSVSAQGEYLEIDVADSGPGVPPQEREVIFQRFRQLDGGTTRRFGGTGLGLNIVRDFVELHRGKVTVTDADEGGALFRLRIPMKAPPEVQVKSRPTQSADGDARVGEQVIARLREEVRSYNEEDGAEQRPLVMVVEDNSDMNRFVCDALQNAGYRTLHYFDGRAALQGLQDNVPDLVLTDIMMPEMGGDQLVEALRAQPSMDRVPVVLLTAKADDDLRIKLLQQGAQDYLMKPFSVAELLARIDNLVTMKRARDVLQQAIEAQTDDLERLASEVTARKQELQRSLEAMRVAREQAEQASQIKTDFLGLVSHELRTPITALQLQLERLRVESESATPVSGDLVQRMSRSTERLQNLIESLLLYARQQDQPVGEPAAAIDPVPVCRNVAEEAAPLAQEQSLEFTADIPAQLPMVQADPRYLRLILHSLLGNAIKYTEQGRVGLRVEADARAVRFQVHDTGPGLTEAEQLRVFEPFTTGEPVRHKHHAGLGLGLTLARDLARSMHGKIKLESEAGKGSVFSLVVPLDYHD